MSESVESLVKLQLNRLIALEKIMANFKKDSVTRKTKPYFQHRLSRIDELIREFRTTHKLIVCSNITEDDEYLCDDVASQFEEIHLDLFCLLTQRQEEMYPPTTPSTDPAADILPSVSPNRNTSSIQLPQLPVPSFSGRFTEWHSFHDSFSRLIHQNSELNSIQKFHYLKEALSADRDVDIHHMPLTEVNYAIAWDLMIKRYNNPRILFSQHMNALYNLPQLYKEKSDDIKSMLNVANVSINEFKRLKIPIGESDHWVAHYLVTKLPTDTHNAWERHLGSKTEIPTFCELEEFLNTRVFTIDAIENRNMTFKIASAVKPPNNTKHQIHYNHHNSKSGQRLPANVKSFHGVTNVNTTQTESCALCGQAHIIRRCPTFLSQDCYERKAIVDKARLCLNCLSKSHALSKCTSIKNCLQCGQRHHTLLHFPFVTKITPANSVSQPSTQRVSVNFSNLSPSAQEPSVPTPIGIPSSPTAFFDSRGFTNAHTTLATNSTQFGVDMTPARISRHIILATASVVLCNEITNQSISVHALIDQGSEGTLISENAVQQLGLQRRPISADICGVGSETCSHSRSLVSCILHSCHDENFAVHIKSAYVLKQLTAQLPSKEIVPQEMAHLQGLILADPKYYKPKRIDLIIGADLIAQIFEPETRIGHLNQPIAQKTHLGWILSGRITSDTASAVTVRCHHSNIELESLVKKFFENEEVPAVAPVSEQDQWCEEFFRNTHTRQVNGKYLVRLPLKSLYDPNQTLGRSKQIALNRFYQLERRLLSNVDLREQYADGIEDYFRLNQIRPALTTEDQQCSTTGSNKPTVTSCVLPHHAVVKETNGITKLRIVYDASSKTSNGRSLNDLLCTGPSLQNDLPAIILKWRMHRYVFLTDIQKMYRCIDMNQDDANYQRIFWRNKDGKVCEYCLTTVTFGTASAPYTAIRVLHQLAHDEKYRFPLAENILLHEMYVDDVLSGSDTISNAIMLRDQLIAALRSAGMELRKWSSNTHKLLDSIPYEHRSCDPTQQLNSNETIKTLGLHWQPNLDSFTFSLKFSINSSATKRAVLSTIARLFDPLGFLTPITVAAKIILKEIWSTNIKRDDGLYVTLGWDEELPPHINLNWQRFITELPKITTISIPRWLNYSPQQLQSAEIHAFCDGSSSAYAAAVYLRVLYNNNKIFTSLVAAKSKVTPIGSLTIPRVELCGAVLALNLANWVQNTLKPTYGKLPVHFWSDATIVLYWIYGDLNRWKLYVANRISKILSHSTPSQWCHVSTGENPADCATRGLTPTQLKDLELWWSGPSWLMQPKSSWPTCSIHSLNVDDPTLEEKPRKVHAHAIGTSSSFLQRFSSFKKLQRIIAWILRFYYNLYHKIKHETQISGPLIPSELQQSLLYIVRLVQQEVFRTEIHLIQTKQTIPNSSKLVSLTPFLGEKNVLRVRGRLKHSLLPYDQRHPIILPSNHHITKLIIDNAHLGTLHGGIQLTLCTIRKQFWIIHARKTVRNHLKTCIKCFRNKPLPSTQLMGDLPTQRVNPPQRAFYATGVDYTGAIELKSSKYRGHTVYKGYIALFICLATKAVHIEAVTGMSTEHFLWALQRFIARRGICHDLYSDCGTNFIGANTILNINQRRVLREVERDIVPQLAVQGIKWHFNPPHSPNFGGLWEANVKSVKYHLKRIVGGTRLTYEQLSTVLTRIEACLNSRPLCPLTSDPDDLFVLTPGHFLIGDALLSPPETSITKSLTVQYFDMQRLVQQFWTRWSADWLSHLQARPKWRQEEPNLQVNELVLVKDDNLPPAQWLLGRITEIHPGSDQLVRVVTVRTQHGLYKRSLSKICRLPIPSDKEAKDTTMLN